jgi:hypothetical protein
LASQHGVEGGAGVLPWPSWPPVASPVVSPTPSDTRHRSGPTISGAPAADAAGEEPGPSSDGDAVDPSPAETAPIEIVVLALVAVVLGAGARFVTRSPLWLDEALSINIATLPPGEILEALRRDGHPPLYYLLLHYWSAVVGTSDLAVRSLSAVIGLATLPVAWLVGRRRGGSLLGWVLVAVLALSPYAMRYSTETRMYALVILLVLVGYLLVDDLVRRGNVQWWRVGLLAVVAGALLLSHYWSLWLLGALGIVLLWTWRRSTDTAVRRGAGRAVLGLVGGGVVFAWWLPAMLYQSAHTGTPWASADRPSVSLSAALADFAAGAFPDSPVVVVASSLLFALGLFGVARGSRHVDLDVRTAPRFRAEAAVLVGTFGIGLVVNLLTGSAFASRYGAVFFPLYALIVAGGILCFTSRPVRAGVLAGLLVLYGVGVVFNAVVSQRSQARVAAEAIRGVAAPGALVVYCPDQLGPAFSRSLGAGYDEVVYPSFADPERVDWVDYAQRNEEAGRPEAIEAYADEVLRRAEGRGIAVVWAGTYKTLEDQCEALLDELGATRPGRPLVNAQPEKYYEPANVTWYPPTSP